MFNKYVNVLAIQLKYLSISAAVVLVSVCGDHMLAASGGGRQSMVDMYAMAVGDTLIHGIIGFLSWLLVTTCKGQAICEHIVLCEAFICALTALAIDFDHVVAAKSLDIKIITQLPNRPFLHNTSLALAIAVMIMTAGLIGHNWMLHTYGWIFLTASLTHHLRDAVRHGFWLYPYRTPPVPLWLYVPMLTVYPLACSLLMDIVAKEWLERHSFKDNHLNFKYKSVNSFSVEDV